jgi:hypothetical protein
MRLWRVRLGRWALVAAGNSGSKDAERRAVEELAARIHLCARILAIISGSCGF